VKRVVSSVTLRETYAQLGEYTAKFIIDPAVSTGFDSVAIHVRDADGNPMVFSFKRWGTKLTISFVIGPETPDGVSIIDLVLRRPKLDSVRERFAFWVVKP